MKRILITAVLIASAASAFAQASAPASTKIVASVNGETITSARLDQLWNRLPEKMRANYMKSGGGKLGFLQNYLGKRLLVQSAVKSGFDKLPEVQAELEAARESALFDLYVRDVVGSQFVNETTMREFYDQHRDEFNIPERVDLRQIKISTTRRPLPEARKMISAVMLQLFAERDAAGDDMQKVVAAFAEAARKNSEDASAQSGGTRGWVTREQLDRSVGEAAFTMKLRTISGIIEGDDALYLIMVEGREQASLEPYESARPALRDFMMQGNVQKVLEVVNKTTADLRAASKVEVFPENVE
jgi:peptidyl-prolyl cis-trans isomerase C